MPLTLSSEHTPVCNIVTPITRVGKTSTMVQRIDAIPIQYAPSLQYIVIIVNS